KTRRTSLHIHVTYSHTKVSAPKTVARKLERKLTLHKKIFLTSVSYNFTGRQNSKKYLQFLLQKYVFYHHAKFQLSTPKIESRSTIRNLRGRKNSTTRV